MKITLGFIFFRISIIQYNILDYTTMSHICRLKRRYVFINFNCYYLYTLQQCQTNVIRSQKRLKYFQIPFSF